MLSERRAKIVATIGPALSSKENLKKAIEAGINVARLNFSHGSHEDHLFSIKTIKALSKELKAPVTILQDLQGPKIRVGRFPEGSIELTEGEVVSISHNYEEGSQGKIPTDFKNIEKVCKPGAKILMDDGLFELVVKEIKGDEVFCKVIYGGTLKDRKGINLPGLELPIDCLTEKDLKDLEFGLENNVDYVALSFVRTGNDIKILRDLINKKNPHIKIIAKIEMLEAIDNLEEIIELSDAVMVARGDLAIEIGHTHLPAMQKKIIALCNEMDRPVVTATQMLDSMVHNPRPTRAEVTDVANAVLDGSDALMLSAESATGDHPFKCISTMHEIIKEVEAGDGFFYYDISLDPDLVEGPEAIAASACLTAMKIDANAIVCLSTSGRTATLVSGFRPKARVISMTKIEDTLNALELPWGIQTFAIDTYNSTDEAIENVEEILVKYGLVSEGDKIVLTLGVPVLSGTKTNSIIVHTVTSKTAPLADNDLPLRCREKFKNEK